MFSTIVLKIKEFFDFIKNSEDLIFEIGDRVF